MCTWKIAGAPGAWGVEDPGNPDNPKYTRVLDDAAEAGYKGLELGPYGYMPLEVEKLHEDLSSRGLSIIAGTVYDDLLDEGNMPEVLDKTRKVCQLLAALPKVAPVKGQRVPTPYLVIIDAVKEERNPLAGHPKEAVRLDTDGWHRLMSHIEEVAVVAASYGIRAVLHPHAGGYVEFEDEIEKAMADLPHDVIGLCLDTGHLYYSEMSPSDFLVKYQERLDYVHFKDIEKTVYNKVMAEHIGFFDGCNMGVMCPIGSGDVDYSSVKGALEAINYNGWITIEQERDPLTCDGSIEDARKSIGYLNSKGFNL